MSSEENAQTRPTERAAETGLRSQSPKARLKMFQHAIIATRLLARVGYAALQDVPHSLPESLRDQVRDILANHLKTIERDGLPWKKIGDNRWVAQTSTGHSLGDDVLFLFEKSQSKDTLNEIARIPLEQSVVTYFAHFEALLYDLFVFACHADPRCLYLSKRHISYRDAIECESQNDVIQLIAKQEADKFGHQPFLEAIKTINEVLNTNICIPQYLLDNFIIAEQARIAFVHTGGFVSPLIKSRIASSAYEQGDRFGIDLNYCDNLADGLLMAAQIVFAAIGSKFWPSELGDIPSDSNAHSAALTNPDADSSSLPAGQ